MALFVRPFAVGDRNDLLQIGAETAFFGAPIEKFIEDRQIFMDAFYSYYTDYEPEHAWVACEDHRIVGFLTGSTDTVRRDSIFRQRILPKVIKKWLLGGYHPGIRTWRYSMALALAEMRGEFPAADLLRFPAHLHINLLPTWRGAGLGKKLIQAYLEQLRSSESPGVHLNTTSENIAACALYEHVGFQLLAACPTHLYAHLGLPAVENRCYGMPLN